MAAIPPLCDFGWKAVDANLIGIDGRQHSILAQAGDKGLVVAFICNHCPYVKAVIQRIVRDARDLKELGIGFVAINANDASAYPADSFENMKVFARENDFPFQYLHDADQTVARTYGAVCTPDFFGFNGAGELTISRTPRCIAQGNGAVRYPPRPVRSDEASCRYGARAARADRVGRLFDQMA